MSWNDEQPGQLLSGEATSQCGLWQMDAVAVESLNMCMYMDVRRGSCTWEMQERWAQA